jgi:hypothetical protein
LGGVFFWPFYLSIDLTGSSGMIQYHQAFMYDISHAHFGWQIGNEIDQLHQIL